jgi:hypothetical protein
LLPYLKTASILTIKKVTRELPFYQLHIAFTPNMRVGVQISYSGRNIRSLLVLAFIDTGLPEIFLSHKHLVPVVIIPQRNTQNKPPQIEQNRFNLYRFFFLIVEYVLLAQAGTVR